LAFAEETPNESQVQLSNYQFVEGDWYLINQSDVNPVPQFFYVNMKIVGDGHMLKNSWNKFKPGFEVDQNNLPDIKVFKKQTEEFGLVLQTFDPAKGAMVTNFFNIGTSAWDIREAVTTVQEGLIETSGEGSDMYGPYQYYTKLEKISDDQHQWVSQRLYQSLGFWITVDSYVATRIKH